MSRLQGINYKAYPAQYDCMTLVFGSSEGIFDIGYLFFEL